MSAFTSPSGRWYSIGNATHPPDSHVQHRPELSYESVWGDLVAKARQGPVFMKDFPTTSPGMARLDCRRRRPGRRRPAVPRRLQPLLPDPRSSQDAYLDVRAVARLHPVRDRLRRAAGPVRPADATLRNPPPVVDADDLLDDAHGVTAAWCEAAGIEFKPKALEWGTSKASEHTWYESGTWHATSRSPPR